MDKKTLFLFLLGVLIITGYPLGFVSAQLQPYAPGGSAPQFSSIEEIMGSIESVIWYVFGTIVIICFVMAGILFLTANGQPEKLSQARSAFIWGIAGVIVGVIAYSIIAIVSGFMTGGFGGWGGSYGGGGCQSGTHYYASGSYTGNGVYVSAGGCF